MTLLQAIWMFASFFIGFYAIEFACVAIKARCTFGVNLIFALLGVLVAYTVMFAKCDIYTTKEKLAALTLLGMARQSVALYAQAGDQEAATETVLTLAAKYAKDGADYSVVSTLEYPSKELQA